MQKIKRKNVRFKPESRTYARIDLNTSGGRFKPTIVALVSEESYSGCGIVVVEGGDLKVGTSLKIKVGDLKPMIAQIRWRKMIDTQVVKLGLLYLE